MSSNASAFTRQFFHGTRADLTRGDVIVVGHGSNYRSENPLSWVCCTGTLDAAIWGAELAIGREPQRIYVVEPTGPIEDDPNVIHKKFPGNPTLSIRSKGNICDERITLPAPIALEVSGLPIRYFQ